MARKEDLEKLILDSYQTVQESEELINLTTNITEKKRYNYDVNQQWKNIRGYLEEYNGILRKLNLSPKREIEEIAAHFPDFEFYKPPAPPTIAPQLPTLCRDYDVQPQPNRYFIAQKFDARADDLLEALDKGFKSFNLAPWRADQRYEVARPLLCKLKDGLQATSFGVFDLDLYQNRNVYLELGMAIGLGQPYMLVKDPQAQVTSLIEGQDYIERTSYASLPAKIQRKAAQFLNDRNTLRYRMDNLPAPSLDNSYLIAHGDLEADDFCLQVAQNLQATGLTPLLLGQDEANNRATKFLQTEGITSKSLLFDGFVAQSRMDAVIKAIQTAQFGVYRIDDNSSPDLFVMLGIAIALNRPFLLVKNKAAKLIADLGGLAILQFNSWGELNNQLSQWVKTLLASQNNPKATITPSYTGNNQPLNSNAANPLEARVEKIQQDNQILPGKFTSVADLEQIKYISPAICRVEAPGFGGVLGTGFLISSSLVLTNCHVLEAVRGPLLLAAKAGKLEFRFGYTTFGTTVNPGVLVSAETNDALVAFSEAKNLDYALLRLQKEALLTAQPLVISATRDLVLGEYVRILQHPEGQPMQFATGTVENVSKDGQRFKYKTNTLPGSSGSPVFDQYWNLVGLHHSGAAFPATEQNNVGNEGIPLKVILAEIQSYLS